MYLRYGIQLGKTIATDRFLNIGSIIPLLFRKTKKQRVNKRKKTSYYKWEQNFIRLDYEHIK